MDNKEAAKIAMEIAVEKLGNRDYDGAKDMALAAAKLFPQLDNIFQLLAVCEVHCSAQLMANGLYDWYTIIQVESISDEILIKKQYHRLALLLHPDKNKFPGAEAAFMLVQEANNTLSDQYKRTIYDVKRRHLVGSASLQQSTQMNAAHYSSNFNGTKQQTSEQQQQSQPQQRFTFWTTCPSCRTRHQYYLNMMSRMVHCTNCSRNFMAIGLLYLNPEDMSGVRKNHQQYPDRGTSRDSSSRTVTGQRRGKRVNADTCEPTADPSPDENPNPSSQPKFSSDVNPKRRGRYHTNGRRAHVVGTSLPLKRSLHNNPCAENNDMEADILRPPKKARIEVKGVQDGDGGMNATNTGTNACTCVEEAATEQDRDQGKEQVEPSGSAGDKDVTNTGTNASTGAEREATKQDRDKGKEHVEPSRSAGGEDVTNTGTNASTSVVREAKEQDRDEGKGQVEPSGSAGGKDGREGSQDRFMDLLMLAQAASDGTFPDSIPKTSTGAELLLKESPARSKERNGREGSTECGGFNPSNGDTSRADKGKEHVEPSRSAGGEDVTNTGTNASTSVVREAKEQDRDEGKGQVEPSGSAGGKDDREGSQARFMDLLMLVQTASDGTFPDSIPKTSTGAELLLKESPARSKERNGREGSTECGGFNPSNGDTSRADKSNDHTLTQRCQSPQPNVHAPLYKHPDTQFHNFDMYRTRGQFQCDQIWALYSELDTYPKLYGRVQKVESEPFKVHISWLKACPESEVEKRWLKANLPISCGKFKFGTQNAIYDNPDYFSHLVTYRGRGKYCEILPKVSEIWAIYKNLSAGWTHHDLVTCEYDIVLIKKLREEAVQVLPMRHVPEYRSVFKPEKVNGSNSYAWEIRASQYILFSHRIPAIRLYGMCKGLWQLDPASVPYTFSTVPIDSVCD